MTPKQKWLLAGIMLLAIGFRFYQITVMPGGLFPDEAANGIDVNSMMRGDLQPFYEGNNGREALFFYMLWPSVELFGRGPWQHHIVSALVGVLSVLGCYLVTRKIFQVFRRKESDDPNSRLKMMSPTNMGLWAAFFMAVSSWHTVLSRTAFRANLIPLFTAFTFYFLILAISATTRGKRYLWAAVSGALFALGFYSYIAYRIMVPLVIVAVLWPILVDIWQTPRFQNIKKFFGPTLLAGLSFTAFISPLIYYFYTHPGTFIGRSGQVSIFNPDLNNDNLIGTFIEVTLTSIRAYFWDGDLNWRHNVSGEPFVSIIISPFFAVGLVGVTYFAARYIFTPIKNKLDWKYFLLAGWFWAMLIPVVTTAEGIPHGLRAIGTIPVVFIITVVGLAWVMIAASKVVNKYWPTLSETQQRILNFSFGLKTVAFIVALILQSYIVYFVYASESPENFFAFRSDLTPVSEYLKEKGDKSNTYLVLDKFSLLTVEYFTTFDARNPEDPRNNPYTQVDPEDSWKLQGLKPGDRIIFTQTSVFDIDKFKQYHPEARLSFEQRNKFNQTIMAVYVIEE